MLARGDIKCCSVHTEPVGGTAVHRIPIECQSHSPAMAVPGSSAGRRRVEEVGVGWGGCVCVCACVCLFVLCCVCVFFFVVEKCGFTPPPPPPLWDETVSMQQTG